MIHLISVEMPNIEEICKKNQSLFSIKQQQGELVDHIDDMRFGDIYFPGADDKVFANIVHPDSNVQVVGL